MSKKPLYRPGRLKEVMNEHDLSFKKSLGQNFLIDGNILRKIVRIADPGPEDTVIEIGPGLGVMTEELLVYAGQVISIEIDAGFWPILEKEFGDEPRFHLIRGDALKTDLARLVEENAGGKKALLVANLPYNITGPLLEKFLAKPLPISSFTIMIQKELADRIMAPPDTKEYGSLSLFVHLYGEVERCMEVSRNSFLPKPKVDSTVIQLKQKADLDYEKADQINQVIRLAFQQRRKFASKAFEKATGIDRNLIDDVFESLSIPPKARPAQLTLENYRDILEALNNI